MAAKTLQVHPAALAELKSAVAWYQKRNQSAALNSVAELDRVIDLVISSPDRWPTGEYGTRSLVLRRYPYAVIYREKETAVQVLAVAHGRRRPGYWKGRL